MIVILKIFEAKKHFLIYNQIYIYQLKKSFIIYQGSFHLIIVFISILNSSKLSNFYNCILIICPYASKIFSNSIFSFPFAIANLFFIEGIKFSYVYLICQSLVKSLPSNPNYILSLKVFSLLWNIEFTADLNLFLKLFQFAIIALWYSSNVLSIISPNLNIGVIKSFKFSSSGLKPLFSLLPLILFFMLSKVFKAECISHHALFTIKCINSTTLKSVSSNNFFPSISFRISYCINCALRQFTISCVYFSNIFSC